MKFSLDSPHPPLYQYRLAAGGGHKPPQADEGPEEMRGASTVVAGVAQLAEQLFCKQQVAGSSPTASLRGDGSHESQFVCAVVRWFGGVPEWPKGADCKSAGLCLPRFESLPAHQTALVWVGELLYVE